MRTTNRHMLRWKIAIQEYRWNMKIIYKEGKSHTNADGLSRWPLDNVKSNPAYDPECNNHSPGVRVFINTPTQAPQISRSTICISIQFQKSSFLKDAYSLCISLLPYPEPCITRAPLDRTPSVHQLSANLDRGPPMEGAAPSRRGGMKSRRSRFFSGLLGGYPGMSEGARAILGEVEDEEGEESVEEEDSGKTEVADSLANAPEVPQGSNIALSSQPLVS
ncbi:hypothetical protein O181_028471 [Austropuccinia psidii MF-1]|uniref:Uncharacterized protein n=1 Tax=Austropuccinia psidii MF-1 TaxID=1389203 RepID=A0A9Q3H2E8_9BASI|nr:hypothetical protein [Austropuccinia psidii MF-1]